MNRQKSIKKILFVFILAAICATNYGQSIFATSDQTGRSINQKIQEQLEQDYARIKPYFIEAYQIYPTIPKGILEAVSFTYTRFAQMPSDTVEEDTESMPRTYSTMGLTLHGKGVFRENLRLVSRLSKTTVSDIVGNDRIAILSYADAFSALQKKHGCFGEAIEDYFPILIELSELPCEKNILVPSGHHLPNFSESMSTFPLYSSLYALLKFLSDNHFDRYRDGQYTIDFENIFGSALEILQKSAVSISKTDKQALSNQSDYPTAIWCPAASCNYAVGRSISPSNIVIHYTSGTYAGSIAWFQNCQAKVSAHYIIRSMDGQVTQMVSESDRAWHVGNENGYTIGIEHEAYGNIYSYFTPVMYQSSANLTRDICSRRAAINPRHIFFRDTLDDGTVLNSGLHNLGGSSACTQIRGHQHYPSQTHTDPGPYWNWNYYYKLVNPNTINNVFNQSTGSFTDSGGNFGNYANNERNLTLIHIEAADSIVLTFNHFDLETDYDFLWIYEGDNPFAREIGKWNTQSPGRVVARGESMLIEFRSDCNDTRSGWQANWQAYLHSEEPQDHSQPTTAIRWDENAWVTRDFQLSFSDSDDVELKYRFYQIMEKNSEWTANPNSGFLCDNFDHYLNNDIWVNDGHWHVTGGELCQTDASQPISYISAYYNGGASPAYLFDFYLTLTSGSKCDFYFHTNTSNFSANNLCGYRITFDQTEHSLSIYRISNGSPTLLVKERHIYYTLGQSYLYRVLWDSEEKIIKVFRHSTLLVSATDNERTNLPPGRHIGFATEHSSLKTDNIRVYIQRPETIFVTVGNNPNALISTQAHNGLAQCKIKSVVIDAADKFSTLEEKSIKVDYTAPPAPNVVSLTQTINRIQSQANISVQWPDVNDSESDIESYFYRIIVDGNDTSDQATAWVPLRNSTAFNTTIHYCNHVAITIAVKTKNGAGLFSGITYSKKISIKDPTLTESNQQNFQSMASKLAASSLRSTAPIKSQTKDYASKAASIYDLSGRLLKHFSFNDNADIDLHDYPPGIYIIRVYSNNKLITSRKVIKR